ncbi:unnamed protein product, partial [Heterosigma akashiwo]
NAILAQLVNPVPSMFKRAKELALETMMEEWPLFMQTEGYRGLKEEGAFSAPVTSLD